LSIFLSLFLCTVFGRDVGFAADGGGFGAAVERTGLALVPTEGFQLGDDLTEGVLIDLVVGVVAELDAVDEIGFAEDFEVLGDGRLGEGAAVGEGFDAVAVFGKNGEEQVAFRVTEGFDGTLVHGVHSFRV